MAGNDEGRMPSCSDEQDRDRTVSELEQALVEAGRRLQERHLLRAGALVFRSGGSPEWGLTMHCSERSFEIVRGHEPDDGPLVEIIGDLDRIAALAQGRRDGRTEFFRGGLRVRGDMHYLSELGMELGFLRSPIL